VNSDSYKDVGWSRTGSGTFVRVDTYLVSCEQLSRVVDRSEKELANGLRELSWTIYLAQRTRRKVAIKKNLLLGDGYA
jgi:hypothetical protein